jgi:two-component system KDP operon response regulator KdpE
MKILVIDSERQTRQLLRTRLEEDGYNVVEAATGKEGVHQAIQSRPCAVLLELALSDINGLTVLKQLREWTQVPILVVSTRNFEDDKIAALDNGANDYITKPFSAGELLARLRVARRLAPPPREEPTSFCCGSLQVDLVACTVLMKGRKIELTDSEYSLLALFITHTGRVLTHGCLLRKLWGTTDPAKMTYLRVYMDHLWEKLQPDPADPELFFANTGIGYRLVLKEKD